MPFKEIYWVPAVEAVCLMGLCIYLLRKYADMPRTNGFVITIVVLGWYMAFSMIFAIPLDIYIVSLFSLIIFVADFHYRTGKSTNGMVVVHLLLWQLRS